MEKIDTFYAVDYDRCLGNVDANLSLLTETVGELSAIDVRNLLTTHESMVSNGKPLSLLEEYDSDLDIDIVLDLYIKKGQARPGFLLELGAIELLEYLNRCGNDYCIMSQGDERWQRAKIAASGLGQIATHIVNHERKSHIISSWRDNGHFVVPASCFPSDTPKVASEVVLIDDKPSAFADLSDGTRGYLVVNNQISDILPEEVIRVSCLGDIVKLENTRNN